MSAQQLTGPARHFATEYEGDRYEQEELDQIAEERAEWVMEAVAKTGKTYFEIDNPFFGKDLGFQHWVDRFFADVDHVTLTDAGDPKGIKVKNVVDASSLMQAQSDKRHAVEALESGDTGGYGKSYYERQAANARDRAIRSVVEPSSVGSGGWIPAKHVNVRITHPGPEDTQIFEDGAAAESGRRTDATIQISKRTHTQFGPKLVVESPYEAKGGDDMEQDGIKDLSWDDYHPSFDGENWTVDDKPREVAERLSEMGWTVGVDQDLLDD